MTDEEKLALAKAAIRMLPSYGTSLRWNQNSWDYALFEKRFGIGISLKDRPLEGGIHAIVVVGDEDMVEGLHARIRGVLSDAGWGRPWREKSAPYRRSRDSKTDEGDL